MLRDLKDKSLINLDYFVALAKNGNSFSFFKFALLVYVLGI